MVRPDRNADVDTDNESETVDPVKSNEQHSPQLWPDIPNPQSPSRDALGAYQSTGIKPVVGS